MSGVIILLCLLLNRVIVHFAAIAPDFHQPVIQRRRVEALLTNGIRIGGELQLQEFFSEPFTGGPRIDERFLERNGVAPQGLHDVHPRQFQVGWNGKGLGQVTDR